MSERKAIVCNLCGGTGYWSHGQLMTTSPQSCPACNGQGWYWTVVE